MGWPVHLTGDISLGSVSIMVTLIVTAITIGARVGAIVTLVGTHTNTLLDHAKRLDRYELVMIETGQHLQRMIGRIEATQDRIDRLTGERHGEGRSH